MRGEPARSLTAGYYAMTMLAMPCYLFTYHAYGSWMPDRKRRYTKREQRYLPQDREMAEHYRRNMKREPVTFDDELQQLIIDEIVTASRFQRFVLRGIGTDPTHAHALVTWIEKRTWAQLRNGIRSSITRRLNKLRGKRNWFVDSASRKRVRNRKHYDYLVNTYLPDHPGWKWSPQKGCYL